MEIMVKDLMKDLESENRTKEILVKVKKERSVMPIRQSGWVEWGSGLTFETSSGFTIISSNP